MKTVVYGRLVSNIHRVKDDDRYVVQVVLDEESVNKLKKVKEQLLTDTFGSNVPKNLRDFLIQKGDDEEYEHTFNQYYIRLKSKKPLSGQPPQPFTCFVKPKNGGTAREVNEAEKVEMFYAGCYVAVSLDTYALTAEQSAKSTKNGLKTPMFHGSVRGILFVKDGEKLNKDVFNAGEFGNFESDIEQQEDDFSIA